MELDELHKAARVMQRGRLELMAAGETGAANTLGESLDKFLNREHDPEYCEQCGDIFCPFGEPLHFHHDGCPCCCTVADEEWDGEKMNSMLLARNR